MEGQDPLANFGPNAALHLRRNHGFADAPDIYVSSFYDPETGDGAAFEEQIGFHGGMGGAQPLAVTMNEGHCLAVEVDPWRIQRRVETRYCDRMTDDLDEALEILRAKS